MNVNTILSSIYNKEAGLQYIHRGPYGGITCGQTGGEGTVTLMLPVYNIYVLSAKCSKTSPRNTRGIARR